MRINSLLPKDRLTVIAWPNAQLDKHGYDARSVYVENYWLSLLGPTATWILRHVANELEANPSGFVMNMPETATIMGVSIKGSNSPFIRGITRLIQFDLAQLQSSNVLAVRRRVPELSQRHVVRLPPTIRDRHDYWIKRQQLLKAS